MIAAASGAKLETSSLPRSHREANMFCDFDDDSRPFSLSSVALFFLLSIFF
jgi:hypothetical protein